MAPGIYKTFKKSLRDNLNKYLDYSTDSDDIKEDIESRIESIINMDYDDLDKLLLSVNYNSTDSILPSNKIIQNSIKDTEKQCYQAMEGIVHNLNTLNSRAGAQTPFSSINLGTDTSKNNNQVKD